MADAQRQALMILGMHRSGTSAFSGVVARLGAQPPKTLMIPTKDNPGGYWESIELMKLNESVLRSAGSRWSDWGPFNPDWIESPIAAQFEQGLPALIEQEFGDAPLLVIKDPRVCRFFPLWKASLARVGIVPKVVIPVRHPMEVARSLEVRDQFGRHRSLLLWLRHVLDAEASSRDVQRTFVSYERLLQDWRSEARKIAETLEFKWPKWSGDVESDIDDFISSQHRHHQATGDSGLGSGELGDWVQKAYAVLQRFTSGDETSNDLRTLGKIRGQFDRTSNIYAAVVREHEKRDAALYDRKKAEALDLSSQLATQLERHESLEKDHATQSQALSERVEKYQELAKKHEAMASAYTEQKQTLAERAEKYQALAKKFETLAASYAEKTELLNRQSETHRETVRKLSELERQLAERNSKYAELAKIHTALEDAFVEQKSALANLKTQAMSQASQLAERNKHYEDLARGHEEKKAALSERHAEIARLKQTIAVLEADQKRLTSQHEHHVETLSNSQAVTVAALQHELEGSRKRHDEELQAHTATRDALKESQSSLQDRFQELAKLTKLVLELEDKLHGHLQEFAAKTHEHAQALESARAGAAEQSRRQEQAFATLKSTADREAVRLRASMQSLREDFAERMDVAANTHQREAALLEYRLAVANVASQSLEYQLSQSRKTISDTRASIDELQRSRYWAMTKLARPKEFQIEPPSAPEVPQDPLEKQAQTLNASDFFDAEWYVAQYPEAARSGLTPEMHYLREGTALGFDPGPRFNTVDYLKMHMDVRSSSMNPLAHYIEYGADEGRQIRTSDRAA